MAPKILNSILRTVVVYLIICASYVYAAEDSHKVTIAVVDVQYVLDQSVAVAGLRDTIDKISEGLHKEFAQKETELKTAEAELVKKRGILTSEQFDSSVSGFYKKVSEAQHHMQQKKIKLEQAHAASIGVVHDNTMKIVKELAKERGFNLAIPSSQILYADDALNITSEVVKRLNDRVKTLNLNYK